MIGLKAMSVMPVTEDSLPKDSSLKEVTEESPEEGVFTSSSALAAAEEASPARDGGWGWIVCFASFSCNILTDGIIFSFGILLITIADEFRESRGATAWVGSLQSGFNFIIGLCFYVVDYSSS